MRFACAYSDHNAVVLLGWLKVNSIDDERLLAHATILVLPHHEPKVGGGNLE